jgi:hypothetical protein
VCVYVVEKEEKKILRFFAYMSVTWPRFFLMHGFLMHTATGSAAPGLSHKNNIVAQIQL